MVPRRSALRCSLLSAGSLIENRLMATEQMDGNMRVVLARLAKALLSVIALLVSLAAGRY